MRTTTQKCKALFSSRNMLQGPLRILSRPVDDLLAINGINEIYRQSVYDQRPVPFHQKVLNSMHVSYRVSEQDRQRIPKEGPVFVVANHCFGGLEGIILCALLCEIRDDVKLLVNYLLSAIPEMQRHFILVDPFGKRTSVERNLKPMKEALKWLNNGGMLGTFPSGEVAHYNLQKRRLLEPEWNPNIAGLIRRGKASALPVYFEGSNSWYFHAAGMIHPSLRTALLPRQLTNKKHRCFQVHIGTPIPFNKLNAQDDMMGYLRMRTYNLSNRNPEKKKRRLVNGVMLKPANKQIIDEPIVPAVPPVLLQDDISTLPATHCLVKKGNLEVWYARSQNIPNILREIGRLRELTFREVGEGTGKPLDLDTYDLYYTHLFLWNRETQEIAAAYRVGPTDEILPVYGRKGLYTHSLFKYRRKLLKQIGPALEMGRTFVRASYQRNFNSLHLIWRGIAEYVLRNPRYRMLFGPVSINGNYQSSSQQLLVSFLKENNFESEMARLVKARMPLNKTRILQLNRRDYPYVVQDINEVETLIDDIETDLKGIPVLLKQYLRLGGKLLGFNVDPDFSYVLDGLILVDLVETAPKVLQHYMGKDNVSLFLDYHRFHG